MCKRKSLGSEELRQPSRPTSPEFSSSSSSSSVSYSSKILNEGTRVEEDVQRANVTPETKAMDLVGCPRCFMYVMLSEVDPKCPKCKSTVFLELFKDANFKAAN